MPFSRSRSIVSRTRSATSWFVRNAPDSQSSASTSVVLPWSTCATIATLRSSERVAMRARLAARAGEQRAGADVPDRGVDELDRVERRQRLLSRGAARSRPGRGSRGSRSRTPARRSRGRAPPSARRARARPRAASRCRSPPSRSRCPARRARRPRGPGSGRATSRDDEREPLGVAEVARVLQRDPQLERMPRRARRRLARGARRRRAPSTANVSRALVAEQPAELLQVRAAARRVHDDEVDVVERVDRVVARTPCPSSSRPAWTESAPQQPCGGATTSKPSAARTRAVAALTSGKTALWTQPVRRPTRARRVPARGRERRNVARGRASAARSRRAGRKRFGIGAARPSGASRSAARMRPRVGEEAEEQPADEAVAERAVELLLDGCARALDQPVVADARGARGDAGHAAEAAVEVLRDRRVQRDRPVEARVHEVDAAARRVHLLAPEHVRRARREAEAAVDAVGRVLADHAASTPCGSSSRADRVRRALDRIVRRLLVTSCDLRCRPCTRRPRPGGRPRR